MIGSLRYLKFDFYTKIKPIYLVLSIDSQSMVDIYNSVYIELEYLSVFNPNYTNYCYLPL